MNTPRATIGFDRFINLEWATEALRIRAGESSLDCLIHMIDSTHTGSAAKKKTRTVLNRLWLEPHPDLMAFSERGLSIYLEALDKPVVPLTWGMAIVTYPFFGKVAEIVGRLTALQGECTASEVYRRMAEIYGEREGTRSVTRMVLQSQANWGAIEWLNSGNRIIRKTTTELTEPKLTSWITEACVRYADRAITVASVGLNPIIYPFSLNGSSSYNLSKCSTLEMRVDSTGNQVVGLATA